MTVDGRYPTALDVCVRLMRQRRYVMGRLHMLNRLSPPAVDVDRRWRAGLLPPAAERALRFVEHQVVPLANLEDALVASVGSPRSAQATASSSDLGHEEIHHAAAQLTALLKGRRPNQREIAARLRDLNQRLTRHLHAEWDTLLPQLAHLDAATATRIEAMLPAVRPVGTGPVHQLYVPRSIDVVRDRLFDVGSGRDVVTQLTAAAQDAARRAVTRGVHGGPLDLRLSVELRPTAFNDDATLVVGRLRSPAPEATVSPVQFEVVITREAAHRTRLAVRYDAIPTHPLSPDASTHQVIPTTMGALSGEMAFIATHGLRRLGDADPAAS